MNDNPKPKSRTSDSAMDARKADEIDRHVGMKIRQYRRLLNFSQQDVGEKIGISYQQLQKYESGVNRISAGRLFVFAKILEVPVEKFYDGLEPPTKTGHQISLDNLEAVLKNPDVKDAIEKLINSISGKKS